MRRQGNGFVQLRNRIRVFAANIDEPMLCADRQRGNGHTFDQRERVALHHHAVGKSTTVTFVRVADYELGLAARFGNVDLPYPYWLRLETLENQISGGVPSAVFPWASAIELTGETAQGIQAEIIPLLETSDGGALDDDYQDISPRSPRITGVVEEEMEPRLVAVAVTGVRSLPEMMAMRAKRSSELLE